MATSRDYYLAIFVQMLPWLVACRGLLFVRFNLYRGLWRYTSIWDLGNIVAGVGLQHRVLLCADALGVRSHRLSAFGLHHRFDAADLHDGRLAADRARIRSGAAAQPRPGKRC